MSYYTKTFTIYTVHFMLPSKNKNISFELVEDHGYPIELRYLFRHNVKALLSI